MTFTRSGNSVLRESFWKNSMRSVKPFAAASCRAKSILSSDSMAKTRRAPARQANSENTPGPQPISATVSPGRTAAAIALAYAPKRPASAIIAPKSRREYISTDGNTGGGGVISGRQALPVRYDQLTKCTDTSWVDMRNDSPYGHLRDKLTKRVELCGTLSPVQKPIHVSILHEFEKGLTSAHCFNPRRIGL